MNIQNNQAVVYRIKSVRKHCNADRLNCAEIFGCNIIVGLEVKPGDLGIYFPEGVQLSEEFSAANNLVRGKDENGNPTGGMFEENRRVRTLKLRGERSEGFWIPVSSLSSFGDISGLKEYECFETFGGVNICKKYVSPLSLAQKRSRQGTAKPESMYFKRHSETGHFHRNLHVLEPGDICYMSEKQHGTSFRCGKIPVEIKIPKWKTFLAKIAGVPIQTNEFKPVHGSRNVVLGEQCEPLRQQIFNTLKDNLKDNEVVYGEAVGYDGHTTIMPTCDNAKLGKDFVKKYGPKTIFHYGNPEGRFSLHIYRITRVTTDGSVVELSWPQLVARCAELGIPPVPLLAGPIAYDGNEESLVKLVDELTEGQSTLAPHIREGCVVRLEKQNGQTIHLKSKSFAFKVLEDIIKDHVVDEEDAA